MMILAAVLLDAGDVAFSPGALTVVGGLLAALTGAIGLLFRNLIKSLERQNDELREDRDYWRGVAVAGTDLADRAVEVAQISTSGKMTRR